ncbi:ClC family H(+)/Cl(-) exchange transporter [Facklamia miroungae]|uniref:H+/Cl-antiporter ClcA n=1 Tax=Facklamia miroungae TaxID=120956 RepID=A0A1G7QJE1_9LACT|nr:ClC family H(+)/Cl(-) exchange transporter [Facklamia miroungae]NKZ28962.1 ClC family H(+)/Cl(-) exchange transporter [Facklamia miroungae]SDF98595.1 H+/Cl-antiporter ClcA [Facklamia miroungae]
MKNNLISFKTLFLSLLTGLATGSVVAGFTIGIRILSNYSQLLLKNAQVNPFDSASFFLLIISFGALAGYCVNKEPDIGGSGIPHVSGHLHNQLRQNWFTVLIYKFFGGLATIGSGLTLGREGPSVQIGSAVGQAVSELTHSNQKVQRYLIAGAAGGGMAAAFNAPLSGLIFMVEELFQRTSRELILYAGVIVITANHSANLIIGNKPAISIPTITTIVPNLTLACLGLGILTGLSGILFNFLIMNGKKIYQNIALPQWLKSMLPFLITGIILFFDHNLFGSGANLITFPLGENPGISQLSYFYFIKLALVALAFCSGIPGGIFFPLLSIGALLGNIYGTSLYSLGLVPQEAILYFSVIAMSSHFAAIVRAPLTGIILIIEMTGAALPWLFPITLVTYLSYLIADFFNCQPIYVSLLNSILSNRPSIDSKN